MRLLLPLAALVLLLTPQKAAPWAVETGQPVPQRGHAFRITCGAFDPSGALLATVDATYTLKIRSWESGALLHSFAAVDEPPVFAAHAPLILLLSGEAELRNYFTGTLLRTLKSPEPIVSAAFSDEDRAVTALTQGGWIVRWSSRGQLLARVRIPGAKAVLRAVFAPDGRTIAVSCKSTDAFSPLLLVDGRAARVVRALDFPGEILDVTWAHEGGRLLVSTGRNSWTDELWLLDGSTGNLSRLPYPATFQESVSSSQGKVYRTLADGSVFVWNGERRAWTPLAAAIPKAAASWLSGDGRWVATGMANGEIRLRQLDGPAERVLPSSPLQARVSLALPARGEFATLGATQRDGRPVGLIVVRDAWSGVLHRTTLASRPISAAAYAAGADLLVTANDAGEVELRKPPDWSAVRRLGDPGDEIQGIAIDSRARWLVVVGRRQQGPALQPLPGGRVFRRVEPVYFQEIWDLTRFRRSELRTKPPGAVLAMTFSADDRQLLCLNRPGILVRLGPGQSSPAHVVAEVPDWISRLDCPRSRRLVLGMGEEAVVRAWSLPGGKLVQKFDVSTPENPVAMALTEDERSLVVGTPTGHVDCFRIGAAAHQRARWLLPATLLELLAFPSQDGGVAVLNDFSARRWDGNLRTVWEADYLETPAGKAEWRCRARDGALIASPQAGGLYRDPSTGQPGLGDPAKLLAPAAWAAHVAQLAGPQAPSGGARSVNRRR